MTRRWAAALIYLLALSCIPFSAVISESAPTVVAVCDDGQPDCQDSSCSSDDCDAPPPVVVPAPRPNVNACVNLGGRRRVSVSGCI